MEQEQKQCQHIIYYLERFDDEALLRNLKECYKIKTKVTGEPIPLKITEEDIECFTKLLKHLSKQSNLLILKELYRCLRNSVVLNNDIQDLIVKETSILNDTDTVVAKLLSEKDNAVMKTILLFLTNLSVGNKYTGNAVWDIFLNYFEDLLKSEDLLNNTLALIYNILCKNPLLTPPDFVISEVLVFVEFKNDSEYVLLLLEHFIRNNYICRTYRALQVPHRIIILEELKDLIVKNDFDFISLEFVTILAEDFKKQSDCILKTVTEYLNKIEPYEVSLLLDVLASLSSTEKYLKHMQSDKHLVIVCTFLLKSIHSVGKEGDNHFTAIQKLSKMDANVSLAEHPAFGFKASLIRILGNLAWKCKEIQDELREMDCIALLLDCCNIDARNPFILQWVIFAVRNVCEKNLANQQVIASMNKQGIIDSATLNELGITLNSDGDTNIQIVPLLNK